MPSIPPSLLLGKNLGSPFLAMSVFLWKSAYIDHHPHLSGLLLIHFQLKISKEHVSLTKQYIFTFRSQMLLLYNATLLSHTLMHKVFNRSWRINKYTTTYTIYINIFKYNKYARTVFITSSQTWWINMRWIRISIFSVGFCIKEGLVDVKQTENILKRVPLKRETLQSKEWRQNLLDPERKEMFKSIKIYVKVVYFEMKNVTFFFLLKEFSGVHIWFLWTSDESYMKKLEKSFSF